MAIHQLQTEQFKKITKDSELNYLISIFENKKINETILFDFENKNENLIFKNNKFSLIKKGKINPFILKIKGQALDIIDFLQGEMDIFSGLRTKRIDFSGSMNILTELIKNLKQ